MCVRKPTMYKKYTVQQYIFFLNKIADRCDEMNVKVAVLFKTILWPWPNID